MTLNSRIWIGVKALSQLGVAQVGQYALYRLGLRSGHYQRQLSAALDRLVHLDRQNFKLHACLPALPEAGTMLEILKGQVEQLYEQADEIVAGNVRLFGGPPVPLVLNLPGPLENWTKYEFMGGRVGSQDIKFIWEPGRFAWACTLAMAYHLSNKEAYAKAFWQYTGQFLSSNPPYLGPHWCSAQEVAIRMVSLAFALQVFAKPGLATEEQIAGITRSIAIHAERIPPTMVYARSQNNNHLVTEALGLYTASVLLPDHHLASRWHALGWRWLMFALDAQIEEDGTYTQHSTNYHRVMLQAAVWAFAIYNQSPYRDRISPRVMGRLVSAARWLARIVDPKTGQVPNLGHNDGAYILPLTVCPYHDYRPVLHAALQAFTRTGISPEGPWCDMSWWLGLAHWPVKSEKNVETSQKRITGQAVSAEPPYVLVHPFMDSWAVLHAVRFRSRPAHCDQLHVDLWWRGLNLALDPGTYLYNAPAPWENSLASALVHNTVTIDGQEFMRRAGRFLYLDWAQAKILTSHYDAGSKSDTISASHDGYRKMRITHTRTVSTSQDGRWEVEDSLDGSLGQAHTVRLHWLLPDWEYEILDASHDTEFPGYAITLRSSSGKVTLQAGAMQPESKQKLDFIQFQLARAGELLVGSGKVLPIAGYYSPTYGVKIPALAYVLEVRGLLPIQLNSQWILPDES